MWLWFQTFQILDHDCYYILLEWLDFLLVFCCRISSANPPQGFSEIPQLEVLSSISPVFFAGMYPVVPRALFPRMSLNISTVSPLEDPSEIQQRFFSGIPPEFSSSILPEAPFVFFLDFFLGVLHYRVQYSCVMLTGIPKGVLQGFAFRFL